MKPEPDDVGVGTAAVFRGRRGEWLVFLILAVLIWPVIAVGVVGGYGFLVWMYQLAAGPPGPPGM